ncbi:PREDICTED: transcription factor bHLH96-like [Ipomoea nil]|uniref:transcription factor bHLH96-like n=1 Tax=Ipomoea nil TaxID=35883 RepID=UPI00090128D6|nr:PREDICTED: transcription factor bHLH96-like [Ipomoea nil]
MLEDNTTTSMDNQSLHGYWDPNSSPEACNGGDHHPSLLVVDGSLPAAAAMDQPPATLSAAAGRRKRRRTRTCKNKEELENQRMTHIAVERNRRKQMNEYLAVIRSMMPASYVQRGDQASIIGGAINFVKELEQHLQTLEAHNRVSNNNNQPDNGGVSSPPLFADFFTFPQYSKTQGATNGVGSSSAGAPEAATSPAENRSALADIEVTMVESHANVKILSKKRPRQLLKIVANLQYLWLTVLHLNVTTVDQMVLYSLSVKLEDGCQLTTVDEIADAVHQLLARIQEEAACTSQN